MFKSLIDGHNCTPHHYLVELVIQREAKKHGKTLQPKFWNTDEWKKKYKMQVIAANSLLKIFSIQDILDGLRCKDGSWIYSLQYRGLIDIINNEKNRKSKAATIQQESQDVKYETPPVFSGTIEVPQLINKKQSLINQLEDIDANVQRVSF